ncbi:MAG: alkaline phosphatase family protein, partial [Planctomycetota bacterium]|nr:alkaline phosphatase family protein [Planctomycetota bacterium]
EILEETANPPKRLYVFLLDGMHHTELEARLAEDPAALPNLRRIRERAAVLASGQIVNFPSITWPSHTTIGSGTWGGHHDVVNPTYYLREKRESASPQGQQVKTEGFASPAVESLSEAFHRVLGPDCMTAAIYAPFGRSARHAALEDRNLGDRRRLRSLTEALLADRNPRWAGEFSGVEDESVLDSRGVAQVIELFTRDDLPPPSFVFHELVLTDGAGHDYGPHGDGLREALDETDRRVGRVLDVLEETGLSDEFLLVVTADHGMAPQDVSLEANPSWHVDRIGMAATVAEPMIWLHDLAVTAERAEDGRTGRVFVHENDRLPSGERPPGEGAPGGVRLREGHPELCAGHTGPGGVYGFGVPSDVPSEDLELEIQNEGFNPRVIGLDGSPRAIDLRAALYGA